MSELRETLKKLTYVLKIEPPMTHDGDVLVQPAIAYGQGSLVPLLTEQQVDAIIPTIEKHMREERYRLTSHWVEVVKASGNRYAKGRLDEFKCMKSERPLDPVYWDEHHRRELEAAVTASDLGPIELTPVNYDPVMTRTHLLVPKNMKCHKCGAEEPWTDPLREEVAKTLKSLEP